MFVAHYTACRFKSPCRQNLCRLPRKMCDQSYDKSMDELEDNSLVHITEAVEDNLDFWRENEEDII